MTPNLMEFSDEALRWNTEMHFDKIEDDFTSLLEPALHQAFQKPFFPSSFPS